MDMKTAPLGQDPIDFYVETSGARVGHRIRKIRIARGMTQAALGAAVELDANRIQKYENGFRKPKAELLKKIAAALNVSTLALVDPTTTSLIGAMYALFEMEDTFNISVEKGTEDQPATISLSVDDSSELYPYIKEWLDVHNQVTARLETVSSDKDRDNVLQAYQNWKWSYPQAAIDLDETSRTKEELLKKIRALQEEYDKL